MHANAHFDTFESPNPKDRHSHLNIALHQHSIILFVHAHMKISLFFFNERQKTLENHCNILYNIGYNLILNKYSH